MNTIFKVGDIFQCGTTTIQIVHLQDGKIKWQYINKYLIDNYGRLILNDRSPCNGSLDQTFVDYINSNFTKINTYPEYDVICDDCEEFCNQKCKC